MITSSATDPVQYWEHFSIQPSDFEHLMGFLVENEHPFTISELAQELTRFRQQQITDLFTQTMTQGRIYRPGDSYEMGETLIFPHMQNLVGVVLSVREGHNPEFDPFSVLKIQMEEGDVREFAVNMKVEHPLNTASYFATDEADATPFEKYGADITNNLRQALERNVSFVNVSDKWFVRDLIVEVTPGQLNLVEAFLDMEEGGPLRSDAFLSVIELPAEIPQPLQLFSLEYCLIHDRRFDEVGPASHALWYLTSMEPQMVVQTPKLLHYVPIPYNRGMLDDVMLAMIQQAQDEWSETIGKVVDHDKVTIILSYPHWRSGTLPLAAHVSRLFPTARITDRIRFTFVDGTSGDEFPGWVVRSGRYVYGLKDWFKATSVGVGGYVDLSRGDEPGKILVNVRPIRSRRREWLRTATVDEGKLTLEVIRVPVTCEYDELVSIAVPDPAAIDELAATLQTLSLETFMDRVFDGLAGLSLQRAVHAMTLYSVINLVRRVPPGPMLATLAQSSKYISLGDNYWAYGGS